MTRSVENKDSHTPFGHWLRHYCKDSKTGLAITNLDYIVEDFKSHRIMLLEEKSFGGNLHYGQSCTFWILDRVLRRHAMAQMGYEYWGFFALRFPKTSDMPGPGMTLNGNMITCEQLVSHLNFEKKFCEGLELPKPKGVQETPGFHAGVRN